MGATAGQDEEEARRRLQKDLDFWICDNKRNLNEDAISKVRLMSPADQRRVIGGGQLDIWKDLGVLFRTLAHSGRERERDLAERKGVDASKFAREASAEEIQTWLSANKDYMDDTATREFEKLAAEDKWRVISEGPLRGCVDPSYAVEQRAKRSSQLSKEVAAIFATRQLQKEQKKEQAPHVPEAPSVAPHVSAKMQDVFNSYVGTEVPAHQRRCGGFGRADEPEKPPLVGNTKGVGGVIEVLKQKYSLSKGQRLRVIGEKGGPAGIWLLEGDKSVPKTHWKEGGWKWVMESEPPAAAPAAPPKAQKAEAKKAGEAKKDSEKKASEAEEEEKGRARSSHRKHKGKRRDTSSSPSDASPPKKAKEKSKQGSGAKGGRRRRRSSSEDSASSRCRSESSSASGRGRKRRRSGSKRKRSRSTRRRR